MGKETAEQKLLKIIEATDAQTAPAGAAASASASNIAQQTAMSVKGTNVAFEIPSALNSFLNIFSKRSSSPGGAVSFGLRELNYLLMVLIACGVLYLVFDFSKGMNYADQKFEYAPTSKSVSGQEGLIPAFKDIAEYLKVVSRRNIFQPWEKTEVAVEAPKTPEDIRRISEQAKDLRLVGISWLDSPESASALIENKNSGVTYFLKKGETINGVSIKTIFADSVILTLGGDDLKLNL